MEQLLLKAATAATTDLGEFEAVISTASVDREGDIVEPQAIVKALSKWAAIGKKMPLRYAHFDPTTGHPVVVGHIDPASARIEADEVITKGWVDRSTERGAETWRLIKSGTMGFSYGYLVPEGGATKRVGRKSGYHITEIDLYEVSVVPVAPANNDTRVLRWKALVQEDVTEDDVKAALEGDASQLTQDVREKLAAMAQQILDTTTDTKAVDQHDEEEPGEARSADSLRKDSRRLELEVAGAEPAATPSGPMPWDDLRRESYRLMADVLSE